MSVEVVSAIVRRQRSGSVSVGVAALARADFDQDLAQLYRIIDVSRPLIVAAMALAERHALRGYDAVQLAAGLEAAALARMAGEAFTFVSADVALLAAAAREGL